jgi:hypothetical protein
MFGDVFGQRGDYSKGIVYGSRRTYLVTDDCSSISPPPELMTKTQARQAKNHQNMDKMHFKTRASACYFSGEGAVGPEQNQGGSKVSKVSMFQRSGKSSLSAQKMIIIEKFSTTNRAAWLEEVQAGCKIYVNKETGEVFDECPWSEMGQQSKERFLTRSLSMCNINGGLPGSMSHPTMNRVETVDSINKKKGPKASSFDGQLMSLTAKDSKDDFTGTGALVYDGEELTNFFEELDSMK